VGAEEAFGLPVGTFLNAYGANQEQAVTLSLDDPVALALRDFMEKHEQWTGTATDLLKELNFQVGYDDVRKRPPQDWPKTGRALSGTLRRIAPNLRGSTEFMLDVQFPKRRTGHSGRRELVVIKVTEATDSTDSTD